MYGEYSDINILRTTSIRCSDIPQFAYNNTATHPDQEPPPIRPRIHFVNVTHHEYTRKENISIGTAFQDDFHPSPPPLTHNTDQLIYTSPIFSTTKLLENSVTPAFILALLATTNSKRFKCPVNRPFLSLRHFCLQMLQTTVTVSALTGISLHIQSVVLAAASSVLKEHLPPDLQ